MKTNISLLPWTVRNKENIYDEDKHFAFTMNSIRNKENIYDEDKHFAFTMNS